ncbi:MAG TPA: tyrosine--tRNA ligase [Vicinamibacterales bacterium]|nr:tyrosine--tRNA ligase [Vicinamibacterales bacterium]
MTVDEQLAYLTKGCVDVVRAGELRAKLARSAETGAPLIVKVGFDPTAPDLHLGHTVLIRKMKHFQDLGHRVVFLIGDFTGLIGDPTGRSKTRPPLTREEIAANAETYKSQVFRMLDPARTVVDFNSRWMTPLGAEGLIRLAARYNVAQMLERRDFKQRFESGKPIAVHEFLYPLAQAYDSVFLKADVELGGTDQLFNLNVGRDIMPGYGLEAQVVMTTPLLEGLDGVEKMSKSLGNYVGVTETPDEMFGKLMSISDELMWRYYLLLTDESVGAIERLRAEAQSGARHPKQVKIDLATRIVADFHSAEAARGAAERFEARFARGELAAEALPEVALAIPEAGVGLAKLVADAGLASSSSEASRKIQQGGVRIDRERVTDARARIEAARLPLVLEVGRRAVRVVVANPGTGVDKRQPDL